MKTTAWGRVNQNHLAILWLIATALALFFMAPAFAGTMTEIILLKLVYITILMIAVFTSMYFLRGTACDVYEKIFDQHNIAAAIFAGALLIALATVIGK